MDNARLMEISEVRATIKQVVHAQPVPDQVIQLARDTFQTMCREATEHGLTQADVIRAVLYPSFESKRGCDCPTCKTRRATAEVEMIERWKFTLSQQAVS